MSLRTRRSLAFPALLVLLVVACTTGTPTPTGTGATPTGTGATPTGTGSTTPAPTGAQTPNPSVGPSNLPVPNALRLYLADSDPATLDPNKAQDSVSISVVSSLHRGLMYFDKDLKVVPSLAADYPVVSEDGLTVTYTLRTDATYSDGSAIVAGDLVYSWKRLATPSLANPYAYIMCSVMGVEKLLPACGKVTDAPSADAEPALVDAIGVEAPDDQTFIVHLRRLDGLLPTFFAAMWPTVPLKQSWVETGPFADAAGYLSSGPYLLSSWTHQSLITLDPNPAWYGDTKGTTKIELNIGGDPDAAFASYQQGNIDTVVVPSTQVRAVLDNPAYADQIVRSPQLSISYYGFANCQEPADACPVNNYEPGVPGTADGRSPLSNKNFRIALVQAVDKQEMVDLTWGGTGQVANSIVMPGIPGYDPDYNPYPYDQDSARTHMATALEELGVIDNNADGAITVSDLGPLTFGYNALSGHEPRVQYLMQSWTDTFADAEGNSLTLNPAGFDFPTFLDYRHQGQFDMSRNAWGADYPHASNQLSDLFRCSGGNNDEQYCNPAFDDLVDQAAQTTNVDDQTALYIQAQRLMLDDAPMIPLRWAEGVYLVQPYVQGLTGTSSDHQNIGDYFYETIHLGQ